MRALPYAPLRGQHTAGAERRAAERALDRLLVEDPDAARAQLEQPNRPPKAFVDTYADELTRTQMPSRAQRRAARPRAVKVRSFSRQLTEQAAITAQAAKLERLQTDERYRAAQAEKRTLTDARRARRRRV